MSFFEIEAFLRSAECDASYAAGVLEKTELDICLAIEKLQKIMPASLFVDPLRPSKNNLTDFGKIYLEYAKPALFSLQTGILAILTHESAMDDMSTIVMNLCPDISKEVLADSITESLKNEIFDKVQLNIITTNEQSDDNPLKFHIIFGHIQQSYKKFFKTLWSAIITQGLYASENYVNDVGIPRTIHDLINHTVIVCGDSLKGTLENEFNWHLRGEYGIPKFTPSIVVSNQLALYSAVNVDLGIGPLFCYKSRHLFRVLPWISGPVSTLEFATRIDIPEKLQKHVEIFSDILKTRLKAAGVKLMNEEGEYED